MLHSCWRWELVKKEKKRSENGDDDGDNNDDDDFVHEEEADDENQVITMTTMLKIKLGMTSMIVAVMFHDDYVVAVAVIEYADHYEYCRC